MRIKFRDGTIIEKELPKEISAEEFFITINNLQKTVDFYLKQTSKVEEFSEKKTYRSMLKVSSEVLEKIKKLRKQGLPESKISEELGMSISWLSNKVLNGKVPSRIDDLRGEVNGKGSNSETL